MSQCPNCGRDLPGFQTLCQTCYDEEYRHIAQPKAWLSGVTLRLTRQNLFAFLVLFTYVFCLERFDIPYLHHYHYRSNTVSVVLAALFGSIAFFERIKR